MRTPFSLKTIFIALFLTGLNPLNTAAQLIDNSGGDVFTDQPFFNEKVIKEKGIQSISGTQIHYKLGDRPRETEYFKAYIFNEEGQLVQQMESIELTKVKDTLITFYDYDEKGNLSAIRQRDSYGNYAYIYEYDDKGRVIHKEYRENFTAKTNNSPGFLLGEEFIVSSENSTYKTFEDYQKRTIYSSSGSPYKEILTYFNDEGLIIKEFERLNRVAGSKTTQFYYNQNNKLDSISARSNISGFQNRSFAFEYDDYGNLVKKEEFKNGKYITQYQVLYDEKTMLIDDVLVQTLATDFIRVIELRAYSYF